MADNQLEILIKFGLSKEKATEAVSELKKLKDVTTEVGKEGVKQEAAVEEATKKTFTSKKQLKDMLKQLQHEFPILGRLGTLALNPIAFTTAAITGAFVIWKTRTDELTKSLGGVEWPDISEDYLAAQDKKAARMVATFEKAVSQVKTRLKELQDQIDSNAKLAESLGIDVGTGPAKEKADLATRFGLGLVAGGLDKMREGSPISADDLEKARVLAAAAVEDNKTRSQRIDAIDQTRMGKGSSFMNAARYYLRYGFASYADALASEQMQMDSNKNTIDYYTKMKDRADRFATGRGEREAGLAILGENVSARRGIRNQDAAAFMQAFSAVDTSNLVTLGPKLSAMVRTLMEMLNSVEKAQRELDQKQRAQNQRP